VRIPTLATLHKGALGRVIAVALLTAAAVLLLRQVPVERPVQWLSQQAESLGPWAPAAFVGLFVGLTVVLLPGWPLNVLAGVIFGPFLGAALTALASNVAASVSFFIGRGLGKKKAAQLARRYPKVHAVYRTFGRRGSWRLVAAVRLSHALPFGLQNFLLGASPVGFWTYLLTTFAVTLPGICLITYLGYLGAVWGTMEVDVGPRQSPFQWTLRAAGLAVAAAALYYLARVIRRAIKEELAGQEDEHNRPAPSKSGAG
jgi:uncharacterized membrane protein YdjX (TVP38/TMEM64 family)